MSEFDDEILEILDKRLHLIRVGRKTWDVVASLKALSEETAHEYEDRFLLELLQNAYDAEPRGSDQGRVHFLLSRQDEAPVLYVANTGRPFHREDVEALSNLAQSSKAPGEGIGNKGLGFRSVLQVCEWPEVFSTNPRRKDSGLGYCFGFARPEDLATLAADPDEQAQLEEGVPPSALPIPRQIMDESVRRLLDAGFATVVRLPLTRPGAFETARERLLGLLDLEVPPLLFLDRLSAVEVAFDGVAEEDFCLTRETSAVSFGLPDGVSAAEVETGGAKYGVFEREIDAATMREQIERSIEAGELSEGWRLWDTSASIAVGVPLADDAVEGRLYTYLPMSAAAPISGHINAPFYTKLARLEVNLRVGLNDFLINEVAKLAAASAAHLVGETDHVWRNVAVDLICWSGDHAARFRRAAEAISGLPKVPSLVRSKPDWTVISEIIHWPEGIGDTFFSPAAVSRSADRAVIDPALGAVRTKRLQEVASATWGVDLDPTDDEAGEITERIAEHAFRRRSFKRWNLFYKELAHLANQFGEEVLQRRSLLVDQSGKLRRCGPWDAKNRADKPVFLPPVSADGAAAEGSGPIQLPASLAPVVPVLHPKIELLRQEGARRVRTEISEVLRRSDLVREYKKEHIVRALAEASVRARSEGRRAEILEQLYRLFVSGPRGTEDFEDLHVMVPTRTAWLPASEAVFGDGWTGTMGPRTAVVSASIDDPHLRALGERLLLPPDGWPFEFEDKEILIRFLRLIGITDGLAPRRLQMDQLREDGAFWRPETVASRVPLPEAEREIWIRAVRSDFVPPKHPYTPYRSGVLWDLPGHLEIAEHPTELRMSYAHLIAQSLGNWDAGSLEFRFRRYKTIHKTYPDLQRWPSPAAALLAEVPWIPVTGPDNRDRPDFVRPREAWHFDDQDRRPPAFATLVAAQVGQVLDRHPASRTRLGKLGLKFWTNPETADDRLAMLSRIVDRGDIRESDVDALKKAVREAFHDCLEHELLDADTPIVVQRGHRLEVLGPEEPAYLPTDSPGFVDRLLDSLDFPVAIVDPEDVAAISNQAPDLTSRLRLAGELNVQVETEEGGVEPDRAHPALLELAPSLVEWLLLTSELSRNKFLRLGSRALEDMIATLRRVRLIRAGDVRVRVDGEVVHLPPHLSGCVPLHDDTAPTLVIRDPEGALGWELVGDAADALAELLQQPRMASELRLSATDMSRVMGGELRQPSVEEWAQGLRESHQRVREILARLQAHAERLRELLVPALYMIAGAMAATALREARTPTLEELEAQLSRHIAPDRATHLIKEGQRSGTLSDLRDSLDLDFRGFNAALEALGGSYAPIHEVEEHHRVIQAVLAHHKAQIAEALRVKYLSTFDQRGDLQEYVDLKRGPDFEPRREDLDAFSSPPDEIVLDRINEWLSSHGCPHLGGETASLRPIREVRSRNLETLRQVLPELSLLISAWTSKEVSGVEQAPRWSVEDVVSALDRSGWLDFRVLDPASIPALLHSRGYWPPNMPQTRSLADLGVTEEEVERARQVRGTEEEARRQRRHTIAVASQEVDAEDLAAVVQAVANTIDDRILRSSRRQRSPMAPKPSGGKSRSGSRTRSGKQSMKGLSDAQRSAIGLAGEVIAFQWLREQYEEADDDSWVSGNRSVLLGGDGDDALGYDFIVHQRSQTVRFEVKATAGDETAFELTENEVRVAQAANTRNPYRIIFIRNVLDPDKRTLDVLPNPFAQEGGEQYRMIGRGVRFAFRL